MTTMNDCNDSDVNVSSRSMGQILIRNIDDAVLDALRRRAAASGTSMEEEARRALASAVGLEREAAVRRLADMRRRIGHLTDANSLHDLRLDRGRDAR
jgi:antitoxin FitA